MKGNVDYEQIKNSVTALEVGEAKEKSTEGTTIINLITGSDSELAKISKKHDDYLLVVLNRYTSTIDRIPKSITDYSDLISKTNEISTTWENVDFNDTNKVLEGFKKIDTILGLTDQNMLSTMYESAGKPGISTNSIDVEGFIASSINVSNYYPVGEYESREDWKNKLVEKYSSQGYSKEVAEALASLEMAKVLVNATGATNASTANSDIEELEKRYKQENKTNNSKTTSKTNNSSTAKTISYRVASTAPASAAAAASQTVQEVVNNTPPSVEEITPPENSTPDTTPPSTEEPSGEQTEPGNGTDNNTDNTTDNTNNINNSNNSNNSNNNTQTPPPASNNNTNNTPSTPQQPQDTTSSNTNRPATGTNNGASYNNSSTFNSTSPQAGPSNTLTPDSSATEVIDGTTSEGEVASGDTTTDLPTGNTGPGSELDVISIDKEPSTSSTSSSNDGGSVIPAVIGVGAAAAAGVAGVKYIKDKKQKDNTYEDEDEDENSFSYLGDYNNDSEDTETTYNNTKYKAGNVNNLVLDEAPSDLHIEEGMPEMTNEELE